MNETLLLLMVIPAIMFGVTIADAASERGSANYPAAAYAEEAADLAARFVGENLTEAQLKDVNTLTVLPTTVQRALTDRVKQAGSLATSGVCDQSEGSGFDVVAMWQPASPTDPAEVAVLVQCPLPDFNVFLGDDTVSALAVRPILP